MRTLFVPFLALTIANPAFAATHIFGGMCASQGTWLQTALQQNQLIVDAITALKDDPDCKVLTQALQQLPKVSVNSQGAAQPASGDLAGSFREISALNDFMAPDKFRNITDAMVSRGEDPKKFQDAVFNVVFNKGYEKLKDLSTSVDLTTDSDATRASETNVSPRLKNYLDESEEIANAAMATSQTVLRAIPQSQNCLHNNPGVAATIFGAAAQTTAALVTGGKVNGVGEFMSTLLNFSRDMKYMKSLKPLEYERFKNSVSCLVESTSESYCATQDAEGALEALKLNGDNSPKTLQQMLAVSASDPVASPVAGLVIYMRDIPVVQDWLQKVLYGMSPRQSWQGMGKNDNWAAYLGFIQSVNSLQANFSDKEQLYYQDAKAADITTKIGRVREIFNDTLGVIRSRNNSGINFYQRAMQDELIPFFLLGIQMPADFNVQMNNLETMWLKWAQSGANGFDNPDHLLQTIKDNLWKLTDKAQGQANQLFAQRMVVDPLNLITAAMRGPGVSAYQAFLDQRTYYNNLISKLQTSVVEMQADDTQKTRRELLASHVPLLKDSVKRLDQVIDALKSVGSVDPGADISTSAQSEQIMNAVYGAANMLVSWDNFFGLRMQTALQADLSDTLWRKSSLSDAQRQYFLSVGPELVTKMAGFYTTDPVSQRTDLSAAKVAQMANLKAVEQQFAKVLFNEILSIDCKLEGGAACDEQVLGQTFDPAGGFIERNKIGNLNLTLSNFRSGRNLLGGLLRWMYPQTEDSKALVQVKAKYCVQALAFESRDSFSEICKGAELVSDMTDDKDSLGLNANFDFELSRVQKVQQASADGHIDRARSAGVCALRSYLRKNHVFYMYRDYNAGN